jgi:maltose O-acetyltransferase
MKIISKILIYLIVKADPSDLIKLYNKMIKLSSDNNFIIYRKVYNLSETFRFNGKDILFYGEGKIFCGDNSYIGNLSTIQASKDCFVKIGTNTSISHNVRIYTSSNDANQDMNSSNEKNKIFGNVTIGNGVWIGANVFINPGITIGDNVVVGANSVITKDLEFNGVYGGVPAKLIRHKDYE